MEEATQILYLRHGRQLLDSQLEEIFGTSDQNSKDLSLTEFLHSLNGIHAKQLKSKVTGKNYKPPPPGRASDGENARARRRDGSRESPKTFLLCVYQARSCRRGSS